MPEPIQRGGCACGAVRYRITPPTAWCANSYAEHDRRESGAPYLAWVGVRYDRFEITAGEDRLRSWKSPDERVRRFCGDCGTPVVTTSALWPAQVHVVAATIDGGPSRLPSGNLYADRRPPWVAFDESLPAFGGPEGSEPLGFGTVFDAVGQADPAVRVASRFDALDLADLLAEAGAAPDPGLDERIEAGPGGLTLVAEVEQVVVGFAELRPVGALEGPGDLLIRRLYVRPDHRPLAATLLDVAGVAADRLGGRRLVLITGDPKIRAAAAAHDIPVVILQ